MNFSTFKTQLPLQKEFCHRKSSEQLSSQALSSEMALSRSSRSSCPQKSSMNKLLLKSSRLSTMSHFSGASTQGSLTDELSVAALNNCRSGGSQVRVSFESSQESHFILQRISQMNHPYILPIIDLQISENHVSFTTVPLKMSLVDLINRHKQAEELIPKETLSRYCYELIDGFQYLNEMFPEINYLEPRSILIDQNDHLRIASFGSLKFSYEKSESSLILSNQVSSVFGVISKRGCQGCNLGAIIAGLCRLKPSLVSNVKLYGDSRKKIIKRKLKNIHLFYGKSFVKLLVNLFDSDIPQNDTINHLKYSLSLALPLKDFAQNPKSPENEKQAQQIITEVSDSESQISPSPKASNIELSKPKAAFLTSELDSVPLFESCIVSFPPSTIPHKPQEENDIPVDSPPNEGQKSSIKKEPIMQQKSFSVGSEDNKEEERPFTNEISKISAEFAQDLNEEMLELKNFFQPVSSPISSPQEPLANLAYSILRGKRADMSLISRDQFEAIFSLASRMIRTNQPQKLQGLKSLNIAIGPQEDLGEAEKSKESSKNCSAELRELNISPWHNLSESREDHDRILLKQKGLNTTESCQKSPLSKIKKLLSEKRLTTFSIE